jgi:hypothetical protein
MKFDWGAHPTTVKMYAGSTKKDLMFGGAVLAPRLERGGRRVLIMRLPRTSTGGMIAPVRRMVLAKP